MKRKFNAVNAMVCLIAVLFMIFQMIPGRHFGFHRDELLYLALGNHPAFGYNTVPPLIGWLAWVSVKIFGYTLFAAKFFPAIAGGILVYLCALITRELGGKSFSQLLASVSIVSSLLFVRAFHLFQPVPFDILFWTLLIYLLIRYFNAKNNKYLLWMGFIAGLGMLNKYNILFLLFALFLVILFTKHRKLLSFRTTWQAAGLALIIMLPNLIWQIRHDFPVIQHMNELKDTQLVNMNAVMFLAEQLLMVIPATMLVVPGLLFFLWLEEFRKYRMIVVLFLTVLVLYVLFKGKSYYSAGIYPVMIAASSAAASKGLKRLVPRIVLVCGILFSGIIILPMGRPIWNPERMVEWFDKSESVTGNNAVRRDEDNRYNKLPQDYSDMLGWDELVGHVNHAWNLVLDKKSCIIFCENYGHAGAVSVLGKKYGLPEPLSFNESFRYWLPQSFSREITAVIYVNNEVGEDVNSLFADTREIGKISNPLAREYGTGVYLCTSPKQSFNEFWRKTVKVISE